MNIIKKIIKVSLNIIRFTIVSVCLLVKRVSESLTRWIDEVYQLALNEI